MALKSYKPSTPGQRQLVLVDKSGLHKGTPVKALTEGKHSKGGRNNTGRVVVRWQGGGHKQRYRLIDFKRRKFDQPAIVERLEYDPNRTSFIALIKYKDGELAYILAPQRLAVGDTVVSGERVDVKIGNAMPLSALPVGTIVHNIALAKQFGKLKIGRALVVDGEFDKNFQLSARNLADVALLPVVGINVYDIMRSDQLVLTTAAVKAIEARLG